MAAGHVTEYALNLKLIDSSSGLIGLTTDAIITISGLYFTDRAANPQRLECVRNIIFHCSLPFGLKFKYILFMTS